VALGKKVENTLVTVAIEPSEIPWVKVFTKRKVKEFSQCTTAEKAEIFRILPPHWLWKITVCFKTRHNMPVDLGQ
jgi:hypothetical protein